MSNELPVQNQVLTLAINGDITLDVFADSVRNFRMLIDGLAIEVAPGERVIWALETLESGSAVMGVRPLVDSPKIIISLVLAWAVIGRALQQDSEIPFGEGVRKPAIEIARLVERGAPSVVFQTNDEDIPVASRYNPHANLIHKPKVSIGTLKGRIDTLGRRRGVRFTLYDTLFDKPIPCFLPEGREDMVRNFWGRKVIVSGRISRDGETGKPYAIRNITNIELANASEPGSWRNAVGVLDLSGNGPEFLQGVAQ